MLPTGIKLDDSVALPRTTLMEPAFKSCYSYRFLQQAGRMRGKNTWVTQIVTVIYSFDRVAVLLRIRLLSHRPTKMSVAAVLLWLIGKHVSARSILDKGTPSSWIKLVWKCNGWYSKNTARTGLTPSIRFTQTGKSTDIPVQWQEETVLGTYLVDLRFFICTVLNLLCRLFHYQSINDFRQRILMKFSKWSTNYHLFGKLPK